MSELAIVSARRALLRQLAEEDHNGARLVLRMAEDPSSFLSIVQIGMTLNSVFAGAFSGATFAGPLGIYLNSIDWIAPNGEGVALGLTVAIVSYVNLVIGELVPKRIGLAYAEPIAVRVAVIMGFIATIAAPLVWVLRQSTDFVLFVMRLHNPPEQGVTEEEIKDMIAEGTSSGALKPAEKNMLEGVMRLADRSVRTIMTPRMDMVWLNIDDTPREHKNLIRSSGYSRFPVARDGMEEILGMVHAKDLLNASFDAPLAIKSAIRPALIIPDTTPVLRLLDQFKQSGQHIALIVDEYGTVEGLVSVTDIIESITGELPERGRDGLDAPVQREDGSWLIDGMMPIDELEDLTGLKNMRGERDFETLAGFVVEHLGRVPVTGDHFTWEETRFEVVDMDARRVDKVIVTLPRKDDTSPVAG